MQYFRGNGNMVFLFIFLIDNFAMLECSKWSKHSPKRKMYQKCPCTLAASIQHTFHAESGTSSQYTPLSRFVAMGSKNEKVSFHPETHFGLVRVDFRWNVFQNGCFFNQNGRQSLGNDVHIHKPSLHCSYIDSSSNLCQETNVKQKYCNT